MSSINAYLYPVNDLDRISANIRKEEMTFVTNYNYEFKRNRNEVGKPYGPTEYAILSITFKSAKDRAKKFYEQLQTNETFNYCLFINANFNNGTLDNSSHNILKFKGYIVDIAEDYNYSIKGDVATKYYTTTIQILVTKMVYQDKNGNQKALTTNKQ